MGNMEKYTRREVGKKWKRRDKESSERKGNTREYGNKGWRKGNMRKQRKESVRRKGMHEEGDVGRKEMRECTV